MTFSSIDNRIAKGGKTNRLMDFVMVEIKDLPPTYRIQPGAPGSATGKDKRSVIKQPANKHEDEAKRRKPRRDDNSHLDEYA